MSTVQTEHQLIDDENPEYVDSSHYEVEERLENDSYCDFDDFLPPSKSTLFRKIFSALTPFYLLFQELGEKEFVNLQSEKNFSKFQQAYAAITKGSATSVSLDEATVVRVNDLLASWLLSLEANNGKQLKQMKQQLEEQYQLNMMYKYSPFKAVKFGALAILELAKKHQGQLSSKKNKSYQPLLTIAVMYGQNQAVKILLKDLVESIGSNTTYDYYHFDSVIQVIPLVCQRKDTVTLKEIQEILPAAAFQIVITHALSYTCHGEAVACATFLSTHVPQMFDRNKLLKNAVHNGLFDLAKLVIESPNLQSQPLALTTDTIQMVICASGLPEADKITLIDLIISKGSTPLAVQHIEAAGRYQQTLVHLISKYVHSSENTLGLKLSVSEQQSIFRQAVLSDQQSLLRFLYTKFDIKPETNIESKLVAIREFRTNVYQFLVEKGVRVPEQKLAETIPRIINHLSYDSSSMLAMLLKDNRYCQILLDNLHHVQFIQTLVQRENKDVLAEVLNAGLEFSVPKAEVPTTRNEQVQYKVARIGVPPSYYVVEHAIGKYYHSVVPVKAELKILTTGASVPFFVNATSISHALKLLDNKMEMVDQGENIPKPSRVTTQSAIASLSNNKKKQWLYFFLFKGKWVLMNDDESTWSKWCTLEYRPPSQYLAFNSAPVLIRVVHCGMFISAVDGRTSIPAKFQDLRIISQDVVHKDPASLTETS